MLRVVIGLFYVILLQSCCTSNGDLFVQGKMDAIVRDGKIRPDKNRTSGPNFQLRAVGDTFRIRENQHFTLEVPSAFNLGTTTIQIDSLDDVTTGGASTPLYRGMLVSTCKAVVVLDKKCQRVNWYNPYGLPEIDVAIDTPHQVVVTPLTNINCTRIGFEIRLGDTQTDNCSSPALELLQRCRTGKGAKSTFKPTPPPQRGSTIEIAEILF